MTSLSFLGYDIYNLRVLLRFKTEELMKKHLAFREDWIKNERCACVNELREGITINCKHYNSAVKKHLLEEEEKIKKLGYSILYMELRNNPQFPNHWLHRLKL